MGDGAPASLQGRELQEAVLAPLKQMAFALLLVAYVLNVQYSVKIWFLRLDLLRQRFHIKNL